MKQPPVAGTGRPSKCNGSCPARPDGSNPQAAYATPSQSWPRINASADSRRAKRTACAQLPLRQSVKQCRFVLACARECAVSAVFVPVLSCFSSRGRTGSCSRQRPRRNGILRARRGTAADRPWQVSRCGPLDAGRSGLHEGIPSPSGRVAGPSPVPGHPTAHNDCGKFRNEQYEVCC